MAHEIQSMPSILVALHIEELVAPLERTSLKSGASSGAPEIRRLTEKSGPN